MYFANQERIVEGATKLSWVLKAQPGPVHAVVIPLFVSVQFIDFDGVRGVALDPEGTSIPYTVRVVTSNAVWSHDRYIWPQKQGVSVAYGDQEYELFYIKEVVPGGGKGTLYFHAFPPVEFAPEMGGDGSVEDTPVMYEESFLGS